MAKHPEVVASLEAAGAAGRLATLVRRPKRASPIDGIVVSVGIRWVVIARLVPGAFFDGFSAVRIRDVATVGRVPEHDWRSRWLHVSGEGPAVLEPIDPSTTSTLLGTVGHRFGVVSIHLDRSRLPDGILGQIKGVHDKQLRLRRVDPVAAKASGPSDVVAFNAITRVDFGARQARALAWALDQRRP